jgi:hypothetical protein
MYPTTASTAIARIGGFPFLFNEYSFHVVGNNANLAMLFVVEANQTKGVFCMATNFNSAVTNAQLSNANILINITTILN